MKKILDTVSSVAVVALCGFGAYNFLGTTSRGGRAKTEPPAELVSLAGAEVEGSPDAKVALVVFSDFECPFCGKFANEILPTLTEKYVKTGRVKVAFRNLPLGAHKQALPAAKAAVCAAEQGKFWAAHDGIFKDQEALKGDWQSTFAAKYALNAVTYQACVAAPETDQRIKADVEMATKYHITGTPAVFVGKVMAGGVKVSTVVPGFGTVESFVKPIDGLLR